MMLSLRSSRYIIAYMNRVYNISIRSELTNLSIDTFVFKMSKLRAV